MYDKGLVLGSMTWDLESKVWALGTEASMLARKAQALVDGSFPRMASAVFGVGCLAALEALTHP